MTALTAQEVAGRIERLLERLGCDVLGAEEASTGSIYVKAYIEVPNPDTPLMDIKVRISDHPQGYNESDVDIDPEEYDARKARREIVRRIEEIKGNWLAELRQRARSRADGSLELLDAPGFDPWDDGEPDEVAQKKPTKQRRVNGNRKEKKARLSNAESEWKRTGFSF